MDWDHTESHTSFLSHSGYTSQLESKNIDWDLSPSMFAEVKDKSELTQFNAWMVLALSTCSLMDILEDASLITNESSLADFTNVRCPFWAFTCFIWNIPCPGISTCDFLTLSIQKFLLQTLQNAADRSLVLLNHLKSASQLLL